MKRVHIRIGDVFVANLDRVGKKYFQYIADDQTQLNSNVVRVFADVYPSEATPTMRDIVSARTDFYAHCIIKWGIRMELWQKVGHVVDVGPVDVMFRSSEDSGNPEISVSRRWWVWRINEPATAVGVLTGIYRRSEDGSVIPPASLLYRMKYGKYDFASPGYE